MSGPGGFGVISREILYCWYSLGLQLMAPALIDLSVMSRQDDDSSDELCPLILLTEALTEQTAFLNDDPVSQILLVSVVADGL